MERLSVPYLDCLREENLQKISDRLDQMERQAVGEVLWLPVVQKPDVWFSIAYSGDSILLKYFVQENAVRVSCTTDNSDVYQDSCVEFFIAFNNSTGYYNLEFNAIGTCLFGFGNNRMDRELISPAITSRIRRNSVIETSMDSGITSIKWELTLVIPFEIFIYQGISSLKGMHCKANFYKCGDALPEPHFLSWKRVEAATPNFHLPEFFGSVQFV